MIEGPPGSGKTWLAGEFGWRQRHVFIDGVRHEAAPWGFGIGRRSSQRLGELLYGAIKGGLGREAKALVIVRHGLRMDMVAVEYALNRFVDERPRSKLLLLSPVALPFDLPRVAIEPMPPEELKDAVTRSFIDLSGAELDAIVAAANGSPGQATQLAATAVLRDPQTRIEDAGVRSAWAPDQYGKLTPSSDRAAHRHDVEVVPDDLVSALVRRPELMYGLTPRRSRS